MVEQVGGVSVINGAYPVQFNEILDYCQCKKIKLKDCNKYYFKGQVLLMMILYLVGYKRFLSHSSLTTEIVQKVNLQLFYETVIFKTRRGAPSMTDPLPVHSNTLLIHPPTCVCGFLEPVSSPNSKILWYKYLSKYCRFCFES